MLQKFTFFFLIAFSGLTVSAQGTETFTNIPASSSSYSTRNWPGDNGITWTATDARTDQTLSGSRAIGYRNGTLTSGTIAGGIGNLSFKYLYLFSGVPASLTVRVNGSVIGTVAIPVSVTPATATFNNINISGNVVIEIQQTVSGQRVAIDDLTWTA
ncbi:MAG TPA: hypothetical protein VK498_14035, partial [Ferruginibacter sp.]|nr:hypothetical protein [Ferruginibacter sp.]